MPMVTSVRLQNPSGTFSPNSYCEAWLGVNKGLLTKGKQMDRSGKNISNLSQSTAASVLLKVSALDLGLFKIFLPSFLQRHAHIC